MSRGICNLKFNRKTEPNEKFPTSLPLIFFQYKLKSIKESNLLAYWLQTISADRLSLLASAAFLSSSILMLPLASVPTETIFIPHMAALAGFVPCAETHFDDDLRLPIVFIQMRIIRNSHICNPEKPHEI